MAKSTLPVNYQDDILNSAMGGKRRYRMINNSDGTVSLEDVTTYDQVGSNFGAGQMNATNQAVNESLDKNKVVRDLETIGAITQAGYVPDALALKEVNDSLVNENSESFNFGVKDGVRGFFTDPSRADDCFIPFSRVEDSIEFGLPFFARNEHVFPVTGYRTLRLICTKSYQDNYTWGFNILGWKKDVMTDIPAWTFDTSKYTIKTTNGDVIYTKSNPGSSFLNTEVTVDISEYDYIVFASNGWGGEYWLNI